MSARPLVLFAHGAGAGARSPWMVRWAERLSSIGDVVTFDYPYMAQGKRRPDPLPALVAAHREALARATAAHVPSAVVLAGKSMGSRVGCHLSLEANVDAVVCFGYPLVAATGRRAVRDEVLKALATPILFVQGTRDPLCPLPLLEAVRAQMTSPTRLHVVEEGDHSLTVTRRFLREHATSQDAVDDAVAAAVRTFIERGVRRERPHDAPR